MTRRPRLTPAIADVRRAVRGALAEWLPDAGAAEPASAPAVPGGTGVSMLPVEGNAPGAAGALTPNRRIDEAGGHAVLVLVALSGGADSLALAAATAFEARRLFDVSAGAVIVDHGLQEGSADVATRVAAQASALGLDPVIVRRVEVAGAGGPEAAARQARYAALEAAASETGATAVFLGHTLDDQAETVLLGLARGSGAASLSGMTVVADGPSGEVRDERSDRGDRGDEEVGRDDGWAERVETLAGSGTARGFAYVRPLLGIRRSMTLQFCEDSGLEPWHDPQNLDDAFARVRVRETVLPVLEREIGPGVAEALARTADLLREDAEALDFFAQEQVEELADHAEAGLSLSVKGLANNPAALRQRIIRLAVAAEFGVSLSRTHTLEVASLVTEWHGQGPLHLPGIRVVRQGGLIVFSAVEGSAKASGRSNEGTPGA